MDGEDVTEQDPEPPASEAASRVAADSAVREAWSPSSAALLTGRLGRRGRDIGTVVAPDAR